jgi:hypothetical protein
MRAAPNPADAALAKASVPPAPSPGTPMTYLQRLERLEKEVGEPVEFQPSDFVSFLIDYNAGKRDFGVVWMADAGLPAPGAKAKFLDDECGYLGLQWHEDVARHVVVLRPSWCRDDPRDARDLMRVLTQERPTSVNDETILTGQGKFDAWRIAYDALLTKPENFPAAWRLRTKEQISPSIHIGIQCNEPIPNSFAEAINDDSGRRALIIIDRLSSQPLTENHSLPLGPISWTWHLVSHYSTYHVFDENGRLLDEGYFTDFFGRIRVRNAGDHLRLVENLGKKPFYQASLRIEQGRLVVRDVEGTKDFAEYVQLLRSVMPAS